MKNIIIFFLIFTTLNSFAQLVVKKIKPSDTDPLISTFNADSHYVYINQSVLAKNILLIHLPGSYGKPKRATFFGSLAANLGFHSIGLMYPNIPTVASICSNSSDSSCYENVRREIITGFDYSPSIAVDTTESILNRVKKLLIYLKTNYPSENWAQFLDTNNNLIYSKIIFSGHSQGGGHATLIAKYYPIKRTLCFSSPKDYSRYFNAPAFWLFSENWQTSKSKIYSFEHTSDNYSEQLEILDSLGISEYGSPINVDDNSPPYNYTLQLITSYPVPEGNEHGCTLTDNKTPIVSGEPLFLPVWTYMLTNSDSSSGISTNNNILSGKIDVIFYPNPTNGQLKFHSEKKYKELVISVYNVIGEKLLTVKNKQEINLSPFPIGTYFIKVKIDGTIRFAKITKIK